MRALLLLFTTGDRDPFLLIFTTNVLLLQLLATGDRDLDEARQLHARQRVLGTLRRRESSQGTRCQAQVHHHGMYRLCSLWIECVHIECVIC